MKKILSLLFVLAALYAGAQQQTVISRITNRIQTIPLSDTVTGTIKVDTAYSGAYKTLFYIGTTNLNTTFPSGAIGTSGWMYIYIPSDSILAKVMSVTQVGDATIDSFRVVVDRVVTMTGSKAFKSIKAKDYGWSFQNDGSVSGYANGVVIKTNEAVTMTNQAIQGTGTQSTFQEPVIINAQGTDFLIIERKSQN